LPAGFPALLDTPAPQAYAATMSPIPGKGHDVKPLELTTKDGKKVQLRVPGLPERVKPAGTGERGEAEPPRDDPRPPVNPHHAGL